MTSPALKSRTGTPAPARTRKSTGGFAISALRALNVYAARPYGIYLLSLRSARRSCGSTRFTAIRLNIKIDRDSFATAAHQDAFQDLISTGVDFLMRHVGRNKNEIARIGFGGKFQSLAPAHACLAAHHINDAFQMAMVVCPGLRIRFDRYRTCPQLLCARASEVDRRLAIHAWCRGHVGIELIARDDANSPVIRRRSPGCPPSTARPMRRARFQPWRTR